MGSISPPAALSLGDLAGETGDRASIIHRRLPRAVAVVLEWRPMVLLCEISFSIYMLHGFVLWLCQDIPVSFKARFAFWTGALWLLAAYLLVIGLSYLSFKFIERPAHRALTGR